jgi:transposase InsO family protein
MSRATVKSSRDSRERRPEVYVENQEHCRGVGRGARIERRNCDCDITEHPTREGKVYCCVVLDAFSRKVVGWSIDTQQNTLLVTSALI